MAELVTNLENRIIEIKADPDVGLLFVRHSARAILTAQNAVKKATDTWRTLTGEAQMMTPAIAKAAEEKGEAERLLTKKLIESEKIAKEHGYSLEYVRSIQSSKFTGSEIRALETIQNAIGGIDKSRNLISKNLFALPNVQYVGSLVNVAEQAVKVLKQTRVCSDDEGDNDEENIYSDNDNDNLFEDHSDILKHSDSRFRNEERIEIERMTAVQLKAERQLRSTFDALVALEKDYQYAKSFLPIITPRAERLVNIIGKNLEQAEASVAIAEWRNERLRGIAPPKFLNSVEQATKRVEAVEKGIDELYAVSRDDETRTYRKRRSLNENFIKVSVFYEDTFETVRNDRRALRGLMPSIYDKEKRLIKRQKRRSTGIMSEDLDVGGLEDNFIVTGTNDEHLLDNSCNSYNNNNKNNNKSVMSEKEEVTSYIFEQEKLESQKQENKLLEDAKLAYTDLKKRINEEEERLNILKKKKKKKKKKNENEQLEKDKKLYEKREKERLAKKREISYKKAKKNWRRFLRTMMDQLYSTIRRLRFAQRKILRIKRERTLMLEEDKDSGRRRAIENVAGNVVLKGLDAAWQKKGAYINRENTRKAALQSVKKDKWLDANYIMNEVEKKIPKQKKVAQKEEEEEEEEYQQEQVMSLTLGVLDCTELQAERLSVRQGNSHIYPEDFLAQMFNESLNRLKLRSARKYKIGIDKINLIPFRCNKGELPTRAQRKRFDGFVLTSAISPSTNYFDLPLQTLSSHLQKNHKAALSNNKKVKWIESLRTLIRDMISKKDNLVALGNGHVFLASAFPKLSKIYECLEPKQLDISSVNKKAMNRKQSWECGYLRSRLTEIGENILKSLSIETEEQHEKNVLLPYARDVYLKEFQTSSSIFAPILISNEESNDNIKIDGMVCTTSNLLSLHSIPHVVPVLLRERLLEINDDIKTLNSLKTYANPPRIPLRSELQVPTHTSKLANFVMLFFMNIINGSNLYEAVSVDTCAMKKILTNDNYLDKKPDEKSVLNAKNTDISSVRRNNDDGPSILSGNLIENAVNEIAEVEGKIVHTNTTHMHSVSDIKKAELGKKTYKKGSHTSSFSLNILSRVSQYLPISPHPTFTHYSTSPKIVECGHSSKSDIRSIIHQMVSKNFRNLDNKCRDAILIGVVPTKDNVLLVLPSHSLSNSTNMFQSSENLFDTYDKVLQNRKNIPENFAFSKIGNNKTDTNIFDSWIDQIYNINDHPLDKVNRDDLWSHDVPLIEYCNFKSKRPPKFKRIDGNIHNVADEEDVPIYTLKEFLMLVHKTTMEVCRKFTNNRCEESEMMVKNKVEIWITPVLSDIYRNINISMENLILNELTSDDVASLIGNVAITIASYDNILLKLIRQSKVDWKYIQMLSNDMLFKYGGIEKLSNKNLLSVQKYLRGISAYADGICVPKEMILEGLGANITPIRPLIQVKDLSVAVQQMPAIVKSAKISGLTVFAHTFLSDSSKLDVIYNGSSANEYKRYFALGIDGVISQNLSVASKARLKFIHEMDELASKKSVESPRDTFLEHQNNRERNKINIKRIMNQAQSGNTIKTTSIKKMNPTAAAWKRRDQLRKENQTTPPKKICNQKKKKKNLSPNIPTYYAKRSKSDCMNKLAKQKATFSNNAIKQKQDQPRPPGKAAPKFRSMSSNFNRNKKVYKQGINRIKRRNESYSRREIVEKIIIPFESHEKTLRAVTRELWSQMRSE